MSTTTKQLGFLIKNRGEYKSSPETRYYKDNVVQYMNSSFICDPPDYDETTNPLAYVIEPPLNENSELNKGWKIFAVGSDTLAQQAIEEAKRNAINEINNAIEGYAPVQITGDVTNAADEEDITSVNVQGTNVLKLKDKSYNSLVFSGLGKTNLRKNVQEVTVEGVTTTKNILTQAMMNEANTIYKIQYDYDLNGATINVPAGCTLEFDGGKITNGTLNNDFNVVTNDYSCIDVVTTGFNIIGREKVYSNEIGLIPNDATAATRNNTILQKVANNCKEIILTDTYYTQNQIQVPDSFTIRNGELKYTGSSYESGFIPLNNASINFYNVSFYSNNGNYIVGKLQKLLFNYEVKSIVFDNCYINGCVAVNFAFADQDYSVTPKGIRNFVIRNCVFENTDGGVTIRLNDSVFAEQFLIKGNRVANPNAIFLYSATTNGSTYNASNVQYQTDCVIEDNIFNGKFTPSNSDYWGPILIENKRVFFRRNIIKDYITGGSGFTYEVYSNCDEYYFEDNYIENVCAMPVSGVLNASAEIFFNKAKGSVRCAKRNVWKIDYNKCRQILADKYNVSFTDDQFENINHIYIFLYQNNIELLDFTDNKIEIIGGKLFKSPSSKNVKTAIINNNAFNVEDFNDCALVGFNSGYSKNLVFKNNFVQSLKGTNFAVFYPAGSTQNDYDVVIEISNNLSNIPIVYGTGASKTIYNGNVYMQPISFNTNTFLFNNDNHICIENLRNDFNTAFYIREDYPSGLTFKYNGCNNNIKFSIYKNVALKLEIPTYNYNQVFDIYFDSSNYTIADENGITLQYGTWEETNYITLLEKPLVCIKYKIQTTNNYIYFIVEKQSGGSIPDIKIEFVPKPANLNDVNKGKIRWDNTADKLVVWSGSSWVNIDGTPLN